MGRLHKPRGATLGYLSAVVLAAVLIGGGGGLALWFRTHLGVPPPIIVVAEQPAASTTTIVPTTRPTKTTTAKPVVPPEQIPPQLPDSAAYTAAATTAMPPFVNKSADHYGWFSGDAVSARCDEWNRATVVGSTDATLFVVCGSYFKAFELATGTPIRTGIAGGGGSWSGTGAGISIALTQSALTIAHDGQDPVVQAVIEWWTP
ncbi:hypothetical protein AB0N05_07745 [Nocardia sp. NPDC051030]|uniref:hypothetical protein n=1 Tax=Nocardia sp. NPDC051030 TaxID=3155162 RepID=UPI003430FECE